LNFTGFDADLDRISQYAARTGVFLLMESAYHATSADIVTYCLSTENWNPCKPRR